MGSLDIGSEADIAVLAVERGKFGFLDSKGARFDGAKRITGELTVRKGLVVWDLNGRAGQEWKSFRY